MIDPVKTIRVPGIGIAVQLTEAAREIGVPVQTLHQATRRGRKPIRAKILEPIPGIRITYISHADLKVWLERRANSNLSRIS